MAVGQVILNTFFWNLSTPVGLGRPNRTDDVELVRFGYHMMRIASDINLATPQLRDALRQMRRTGDFDTVIRAHQAEKKIPIDGKVSVAHVTAANRGRYDGHHSWIIVNLNNFMRDFQAYPRIDLHPESGLAISRVAAMLRGV